MTVNICGVPHQIIEVNDFFDGGNCGMIDHIKNEIYVNNKLSEEGRKETICHEIVHGILVHIGRNDLSVDETLVQSLGNAVYQCFDIKENKNGNKCRKDGN